MRYEKNWENWENALRDPVERSAFGVCSYLGSKMRLSSERVRIYFIYTSFVTMGSPIIIYLIVAFWLNIRRYLKRNSITIIE